jgi:hypothetical protein
MKMFVAAHQSVEAMSRSMWQSLKRHIYVTPTNYLETVRNYKALLAEKRTELLAKSNKLKGGLTKLDETRVQAREPNCRAACAWHLGWPMGGVVVLCPASCCAVLVRCRGTNQDSLCPALNALD